MLMPHQRAPWDPSRPALPAEGCAQRGPLLSVARGHGLEAEMGVAYYPTVQPPLGGAGTRGLGQLSKRERR